MKHIRDILPVVVEDLVKRNEGTTKEEMKKTKRNGRTVYLMQFDDMFRQPPGNKKRAEDQAKIWRDVAETWSLYGARPILSGGHHWWGRPTGKKRDTLTMMEYEGKLTRHS